MADWLYLIGVLILFVVSAAGFVTGSAIGIFIGLVSGAGISTLFFGLARVLENQAKILSLLNGKAEETSGAEDQDLKPGESNIDTSVRMKQNEVKTDQQE